MRSKRPFTVRRVNFEALEERCLLTAALGSFERINSDVTTQVEGLADVSTEPPASFIDSSTDQIAASAAGVVVVQDEFGRAQALDHAIGKIFTPGTTSIELVGATNWDRAIAEDLARAETGDMTLLNGDFQYHAPVGNTDNLELHVHLIISANGHDTVSGPALGINYYYFNAVVADYYLEAEHGNDTSQGPLNQTWYVNGVLPEYQVEEQTEGGFFLHAYFTLPITDGSIVPVGMYNQGDALAQSFGEGGHSSLGWARGGWTYFYVTPEGQDLTPGDFNGDDSVNADDFELWSNNSPLADADLDGEIDVDDYSIWAANADAILVSTNVDENDGNYAYGDLSLREAIALAADINHPGADIIAFDGSIFGQLIALTLGQLNIGSTNEVNILGPGADQITINGNGVNSAIFAVSGGGAAPLTSTISHLKLTGTGNSGTGVLHSDSNGNHDLELESLEIVGNGSGVRHTGSGQLAIRDSLVANNYADGIARTTSSPPADFASVTVSDTIVRDNGLSGVTLRNLDASISGSEITGNNTRGLSGKGINFQSNDDNPAVTLSIVDSTIAENHGQGIALGNETISSISNTTISTNDGQGLSVTGGTATLTNVTVTQNKVPSGQTAGVYAGAGGTITLYNTIVAQNYSGTPIPGNEADLGRHTGTPAGSFSVGTSSYNLIGVVGNSGISSSYNNIILGAGIDAGLMALGDYGGATRTHALLLTSLAVDAGDDSKADAIDLVFDQRGEGYDRVVDRDGTPDNGFDIDIGAFELALGEIYA